MFSHAFCAFQVVQDAKGVASQLLVKRFFVPSTIQAAKSNGGKQRSRSAPERDKPDQLVHTRNGDRSYHNAQSATLNNDLNLISHQVRNTFVSEFLTAGAQSNDPSVLFSGLRNHFLSPHQFVKSSPIISSCYASCIATKHASSLTPENLRHNCAGRLLP